MRVLFVCLENVCRSPIAKTIAQGWRLAADPDRGPRHRFDSAGVRASVRGAPLDPRASAALQRHGYQPDAHRARAVTAADFERHDLVVALDRYCLAALRELCDARHAAKLSLLLDWAPACRDEDVPDPYFGPPESFDRVIRLCEQGIAGLLQAASGPAQSPTLPSRRGGRVAGEAPDWSA